MKDALLVVLCLAAMALVLWIPAPDRSFTERPLDAVDFARQARNREIEMDSRMIHLLRCVYCEPEGQYRDQASLLFHLRLVHGDAVADRIARKMADQWHREAGVQ